MPAHGRDRLPLEQPVEVLLALQQSQLAGGQLMLVEPALRLPKRMRDRLDRQRRRAAAPLRRQVRLEDRIHLAPPQIQAERVSAQPTPCRLT